MSSSVYESGGDGGGGGGGGLGAGQGLMCGEQKMPCGSLPNLTSVHFPPPHHLPHRTSPDYNQPRYVSGVPTMMNSYGSLLEDLKMLKTRRAEVHSAGLALGLNYQTYTVAGCVQSDWRLTAYC